MQMTEQLLFRESPNCPETHADLTFGVLFSLLRDI